MEISIAVVAEAANVTQDGNLNIFGIFNEVTARSFPARHPVCVLVTQIRASRSEQGEKVRMTVRLMDEDSVMAELEGDFVIPTAEGAGQPLINNIMRLVGLKFPKPGRYAFHILINGQERQSVPIVLKQIDATVSE